MLIIYLYPERGAKDNHGCSLHVYYLNWLLKENMLAFSESLKKVV